MNQRIIRAVLAFVLALSAGGAGYAVGETNGTGAAAVSIPSQTVEAVPENAVRIIYSLDTKTNDRELIALIDDAEEYAYFAVYTFTLQNVAEALVRAKERGVDVRGIVDKEQAGSSYMKPIVSLLENAGIPVVAQKHASGNGIMHLKTLVTESAYATGSYNWTKSATTINDEVLEIGTDPELRQAYENILKRLLEAYKGNAAAKAAAPVFGGIYDYTEAGDHIGEYASVRGTLLRAKTSKSGTVFLDFCEDYRSCPFTGVIFADDAKQFGDLSSYAGKMVTLTGTIASYEGKAEIILSKPDQLKR